jgi:6-phosphofructokinase 1
MEAVNAVLRSTPDTPSPVIGMRENKVISLPLVDAVAMVSIFFSPSHELTPAFPRPNFACMAS